MKKPLSSCHPILYKLRVTQKRLFCAISWRLSKRSYANTVQEERLPYRLIKHTSRLIRKLGDSDARLQHNKVINLKKAAPYLNRVIIKPNQYFSFWKLVGRPTTEKGFAEKMELFFGCRWRALPNQ